MLTSESADTAAEREAKEHDLRHNGREDQDLRKSREEMAQASAKAEEAIEQLVPAWINASRAFVPPVVYNPWHAMNAMFDAQQQALTLQRKFWGEMLSQSRDAMNEMNSERGRYAYSERWSR